MSSAVEGMDLASRGGREDGVRSSGSTDSASDRSWRSSPSSVCEGVYEAFGSSKALHKVRSGLKGPRRGLQGGFRQGRMEVDRCKRAIFMNDAVVISLGVARLVHVDPSFARRTVRQPHDL